MNNPNTLQVSVEELSPISRKVRVTIPAKVIHSKLEEGFAEAQKTAQLKGFRPGQVPMPMVKKMFGGDVAHRVYHRLVDESFHKAINEKKLQPIGRPTIDGEDEHSGHHLDPDKDFTFFATIEVMPQLKIGKSYEISLEKKQVEVDDSEIDKVVEEVRQSQAQLIPLEGGSLLQADGSPMGRPAEKGDYADIEFDGSVLQDGRLVRKEGMKGTKLIELGSGSLIPGFEDEIVGMTVGQKKIFEISFPEDYGNKDLAGKKSQFQVTLNSLKTKSVPALGDEFAQSAGYENLADLREKAKQEIFREKESSSNQELRNSLLQKLIDGTNFSVPSALIFSQSRVLAEDVAVNLKRQGVADQDIREMLGKEMENLKSRAESQVRASIIIDAIATQESIDVSDEDLENEITRLSIEMKLDEKKLRDHYLESEERKENLRHKIREEKTIDFVLSKCKVKNV